MLRYSGFAPKRQADHANSSTDATGFVAVGVGAVLAAAAAVVAGTPAHARQQETAQVMAATPFSQAEMQALERASAQGLDYVPGDVIFKFKTNTPTPVPAARAHGDPEPAAARRRALVARHRGPA